MRLSLIRVETSSRIILFVENYIYFFSLELLLLYLKGLICQKKAMLIFDLYAHSLGSVDCQFNTIGL